MSKFIEKYNSYWSLLSESFDALGIKEGDVVKFIKNPFKNEYLKDLQNTSTGQTIKEMMQTKNNLIVSGIKSVPPAVYGSYGSRAMNQINNENFVMATVSEQYSDGLHKNVVEVPLAVLERVDTGVNLPPVSDEQKKVYNQSYKGEEPKMNPNTTDPTAQTHASWNDQGGPLPGSSTNKKKVKKKKK